MPALDEGLVYPRVHAFSPFLLSAQHLIFLSRVPTEMCPAVRCFASFDDTCVHDRPGMSSSGVRRAAGPQGQIVAGAEALPGQERSQAQ